MSSILNADYYDSVVVNVESPEGELAVIFLETSSRCVGMMIEIGKNGTSAKAWATTTASLVTHLLHAGESLVNVASILARTSTTRISYDTNNQQICSVPDGIAVAIYKYLRNKQMEKIIAERTTWHP